MPMQILLGRPVDAMSGSIIDLLPLSIERMDIPDFHSG